MFLAALGRPGVLRTWFMWVRLSGVGLLGLLMLTGCPTAPNSGGTGSGADAPILDSDGNSSFQTATALTLASNGLDFRGSISGGNDLDLYNLGELAAGDRLTIDVRTISGNLDPVAAVFDANQTLVGYNDDRTADSSDLNPRLDFVIREGRGAFFLGVSGYAGGDTTGEYLVVVDVNRGEGVPDPQPQIVFLNWAGGANVDVPNVGRFNLAPFNATDLGPYEGQTDRIKDAIEQIVQERYGGYRLFVLNSDDNAVPTVPHSKIHFGGNNRNAFAISEQIDWLNQDPADDAIIFTQSFRGAFSRTPSVTGIAVAVGNTVAHEIGHLLGMVHTADCVELMDTSCGNDRILQDQNFGLAPLDSSVFPVGNQAATELLEWVLGLVGA